MINRTPAKKKLISQLTCIQGEPRQFGSNKQEMNHSALDIQPMCGIREITAKLVKPEAVSS